MQVELNGCFFADPINYHCPARFTVGGYGTCKIIYSLLFQQKNLIKFNNQDLCSMINIPKDSMQVILAIEEL